MGPVYRRKTASSRSSSSLSSSSSSAKQPFWAQASLASFCRTPVFCRELEHQVFTFLDLPVITVLRVQSEVVSLASITYLRDRVALCPHPQVQRGPIIRPELDSLFVTFYDSQGYGRGTVSSVHMGDILKIQARCRFRISIPCCRMKQNQNIL
jgi:hypothetical protein